MARYAYEITVTGSFGQAAREAFPDMEVRTESRIMILSGALDQPSLHALLERVRALGLELLSVRRSGLSPPD
jgi:hypothetical protein